jgi:hypothetical protein
MCQKIGRDTPATIVHHKVKHEGNVELFWDESNLESVCASCHSGSARIAEHFGHSQACGVDGLPLDLGHEWRKRGE